MNNPETVPVLVGISQLEQRVADPAKAKEPLELMIDAVRAAAADAGSNALLQHATSMRVIRGIWPYKNPARIVAQAIGIPNAETVLTPYGGNFVQSTMNQSALDIQAGKHAVIVLTGAECGYTQARARKQNVELKWQEAPGTPDRLIGEDKNMRHDAEKAVGLGQPIQLYPMFENALRHARGESLPAHLTRISELWSRFSEVASHNPHAWIHEHVSAKEIRTPSDSNRPVSFPYPKLMNSNNNVDQAAALILCSVAAAKRFGIPEERWIYPWAGTDAHDHYYVSNRDNLYTSPAIRFAGNRCLELAGVSIADIDHVDLYSCFPVAVQVAAKELGLDEKRPLTVTGGLTFGGGPLNNYVMHSIARMAEVLRGDRDAKGLVTANGGYLTKHAFGVYAAEPPPRAYRHEDLQEKVDREPWREVDLAHRGAVDIESYTVMYGADGPSIGHVVCRTPAGHRAWANTQDRDVMNAMTREEFCGRRATLDGAGGIAFG
ncbi:MAG TPA: acetyl-CoA acetyltransferase [Pseudomonadales bacterium]|nr:acetyl-CoA acetyltransferase [Pseudomonadales bacterium]